MKKKSNICDVCGTSVGSVSDLHRLKKTTPQSWNGSVYAETCLKCSELLDECRASFIQDLRTAFTKRKRAAKRKLTVKKNAKLIDVQKRRVQVPQALRAVHGRSGTAAKLRSVRAN